MPTYGEYRRDVPKIRLVKGYTGNEPQSLHRSAKPKDDENIRSGQLISLDDNGEWVKGCPKGKEPHFAFQDQTDTDVQSIGLLLGFSCSGDYVIETGWFVEGESLVYGEGKFLKAATGADAGKVTLAANAQDDNDVIGFASHGAVQDKAGQNSQAKLTSGKLNLLSLTTKWLPDRTAYTG